MAVPALYPNHAFLCALASIPGLAWLVWVSHSNVLVSCKYSLITLTSLVWSNHIIIVSTMVAVLVIKLRKYILHCLVKEKKCATSAFCLYLFIYWYKTKLIKTDRRIMVWNVKRLNQANENSACLWPLFEKLYDELVWKWYTKPN